MSARLPSQGRGRVGHLRFLIIINMIIVMIAIIVIVIINIHVIIIVVFGMDIIE